MFVVILISSCFCHTKRHDKIAKEEKSVELISELIWAEFLRQNKDKERQMLPEDLPIQESMNAHNALFGGIQCRVKVVGCERQDLNGRLGMLRSWNVEQEKFCVGLDTKKNPDIDVHMIDPGNLEALPVARSKADKKLAQSYNVDIGYDGIGCQFILEKSAIDALRSAETTVLGLKAFCLERDEEERRQRLELEEELRQEEEYRKQEEIDRKRRAKERAARRAEREAAREKMRRENEAARAAFFHQKRLDMLEKFKSEVEDKMINDTLEKLLDDGMFESREQMEKFLEEHGDFDGLGKHYVETCC